MKKQMKKQKNKQNWDSVYIFSGEYTQVKDAKSLVLEENQISFSKSFFKGDDPKLLQSQLFDKGYFYQPTAYIIHDPLTETAKICQNYIENENMREDVVIIINSGETVDNRLSFYTAANKNKRVFSFFYDVAENKKALKSHIQNWCEKHAVNFSSEVANYFVQNAPTINMKVQSGNTKKDSEVFDYVSLDNELQKVKILQTIKPVTTKDLEEICLFSQEIDVWKFTECLLTFNATHIYQMAIKAIKGQNLETLLWGMISSLKFLIQVKTAMDNGENNASVIAEQISSKNIAGKYLLEDWSEPENISPTSINPWRVKINMDNARNVKLSALVHQYKTVLNTLFNLRDGVPQEVALPILVIGLSGEILPDSFILNM